MKPIEKYIPIAIDVVEDLILHTYNEVAPEWDNAIANFGASLRQMGLLTAVTAFSQQSNRAKVDKILLMRCLLRIIRTGEGKLTDAGMELLPIVQNDSSNKMLYRQITDAAIALKLALRVFIINPKEEKEADYE
jgi:hypothetical protein